MGKEIERKFLVLDNSYKAGAQKEEYRQGYICSFANIAVRIRIAGSKAYITIKGCCVGISRAEYEYEIPIADAEEMLSTLCEKPAIEKTRYKLEWAGNIWEIDEFHGVNEGLVVAELEMPYESYTFAKPSWLGKEVTADLRYSNSNLAKYPFSEWP